MEDVAAEVASPLVFHQRMGGPFCSPHTRKRGLPLQSPNFGHQVLSNDWDPDSWGWDSARFVARPLNGDSVLVGSSEQINAELPRINANQSSDPRYKKAVPVGQNGGVLQLQLRDGAGKTSENSVKEPQPFSRPNKKVRSGSPGAPNYPACQVDDCKEDLSTAKDYHRRHKVCEVHSKAVKALVGQQMQRFCQQCSRFHPLSEFDEGKRSCRRRLAGHNRRRRKTQPEDTTQQLDVPGSRDNNSGSEVDIINFLSVLAHAQGNNEDRSGKNSAVPGSNALIQVLSRINSLPLPENLAAKLSLLKDANGSNPIIPAENQSGTSGNASSPSTMDLLPFLSAAYGAPSHDAAENRSNSSTERSDSGKSKSLYHDQAAHINFQRGYMTESPHVQGVKSSGNCHFPVEEVYSDSQETLPNLALQLFSSSPEDDASTGRKLTSDRIFLSSDSSNPSGEGSPICSPPLVRDLFPVQTMETTKVSNVEGEQQVHANTTTDSRCSTSLRLFGGTIQAADAVSHQSSPNPVGYRSSASDNSPTTLNSDTKDRTGRISFKLFDKDPSHLPVSLRTQIFSWLSNSPTEIESYIRPGCIVLSLYLSMPSYSWDHLEENFRYYVSYLVKSIDVDFWGSGRFLVHMDRRMAVHKDGKVRLQKSWRAWSSPELISVSPVAVVPGQETSLLLRGRGLKSAGTKIHCTHTDLYSIREAPASSCVDTLYEEVSLCSFMVNGSASSLLGRCFIEVENNFRGTCFPVIIADEAICQELRLLEPEIDVTAADQNEKSTSSREYALHFLDELGWLFQRKLNSSLHDLPHYKIARFKFLLTFSVDHDFCCLVKNILDILVELNRVREGLIRESYAMLSEIHLLNRAVKRRCRDMVDVLVRYSIIDPTDSTEKFIFAPNAAGPGGITPLHLAACTSSSEDLVDALTNDSLEIGLKSWNSVLDENGLSPHAYALMRNNHSYDAIIAEKLADKRSNQISLTIENVIEQVQASTEDNNKSTSHFFNIHQKQSPCSKCAIAARRGYSNLFPGSQGLLQRPYMHSMLAVAAVCVCVCVILRSHPFVDCTSPLVWEKLHYGAM